MVIATLDRTEWSGFFDRASRILAGMHTEIEIIHPAFGNQVEVRSRPLLGMSYDAKTDTIEIALEGVDHIISKPQIVYVDPAPGLYLSLQIITTEGVQQSHCLYIDHIRVHIVLRFRFRRKMTEGSLMGVKARRAPIAYL